MVRSFFNVLSAAFVCSSIPSWADTDLIDEIIVTANDREKSLRFLSVSAHKIRKEEVLSVSAVHPSELLNRLPGLNIQRGSGQEHLTSIRSPVLTGGAGAGSFLYLLNNVPLRSAGFANVNGLFEAPTELAGSIETLKGPGSVVHGSNAQHGLINILTPGPAANASGEIDLRGGEDGYVATRLYAATPEWSVGTFIAHDDGFRDDSGYDQQKVLGELYHDFDTWSVSGVVSAQNLEQETAGFIQGEDAYRDLDLVTSNAFPEAFRDSHSLLTSFRFERATSTNGLLSLTPYFRHIDMRFLRHFVPGQALEENGHTSVGVQLNQSFQSEKRSTLFGMDIDVTQGFLREFQEQETVFSFVQGDHYDYDVDSLILGLYGHVDWQIDGKLTVDMGLRADYTVYDYTTELEPGFSGRFQVVDDRKDEFIAVTPRLGFTYQFNDSMSSYGRLARGARAPQTSDLYSLQINQEAGGADIETLDSIELGFRHVSARWASHVAGYYMQKRNFFFRDSDGFNEEEGKTTHLGIELSLDVAVTNDLSVKSSVTYAEHLYDFNRDVSSEVNSIEKGDFIDTAPQHVGSLALHYQWLKHLSSELEWRHMGDYFTDPSNTNEYPGHDIVFARLHYQLTDNVLLNFRVDNLTDSRYADRADFAFGSERYFPGRPRSVFVGVRVSL